MTKAIAVLVAALSFALALRAQTVAENARDEAARAQTRADLAQLEVESFKNVLHAARLPSSAHLEGESP